MLSGFRGGPFSWRIDPGFDGLGGRFGRFADEALGVETEGAVEGFLPGGMDGVGLPVMHLIGGIRPISA